MRAFAYPGKLSSAAKKQLAVTTKNVKSFPFFGMKVPNMKAWQLYAGQSLFFFTMGLIVLAVMEILRMVGVGDSKLVVGLRSGIKELGGKSALDGADVGPAAA